MPIKPGKVVQVKGIQTALRALERTRDHVVPAVRAGLLAAGHNVLILAKHYCPKDTHALVNSGRVRVMDNLGTGTKSFRVWVSFGGKVGFTDSTVSAERKPIPGFEPAHLSGQVVYYAVYVHENLAARHDAPTQAKFLERAVRESLDIIAHTLGRAIEVAVAADLSPKDDSSQMNAKRNFGRMKIPPHAPRIG